MYRKDQLHTIVVDKALQIIKPEKGKRQVLNLYLETLT